MPDTPPPVEEEHEEIVVIGTRLKAAPDSGGGGGFFLFWSSYVPADAPDPFAQYGGNETPEIARFEMIDGNVVVSLAGYDFKIVLPAADWDRMRPEQRGEFIKGLNEFRESGLLVGAFDRAQASGVEKIEMRYDTVIHHADGSERNWDGDTHYGFTSFIHPKNSDDTIDLSRIDRVVININANVFPRADGTFPMQVNMQGELEVVTFTSVFMHEVRHIHYVTTGFPGTLQQEEDLDRAEADRMMDDICSTPGAVERSPADYLESETFIGSRNNDTASGTSGSDTMSGLTGNDTLNGGAGDDLVMGGAGMDVLSGGTGSNYVLGGLDADTYVPQSGVTAEVVGEIGGVDRIDLSRVSVHSVTFRRLGDTLLLEYHTAGGYEEVQIENHWIDGGRVEQFTFAEGTFAASYIEELAGASGGGVCYDGPNPVICGPYGLPVVLDLDGDGLELIAMADSRARFDINGDGTRERIGWVEGDDGLLALDRNGNGRIDDFSEISFLQDFLGAGSDLEGLFAYDTDKNGHLSAADARYAEFRVWRDLNGNGHSEKNELFSLDEVGIVSIALERRNVSPLDIDAGRNQVLATSTFEMVDGRIFQVGDIALFSSIGDCGCHSRGGIESRDNWESFIS